MPGPTVDREVGRPPRVALAVMAKVPIAGEVKTRLCPPLTPVEAAALARCFIQDRVEQLAALPVGDPLVAFAPHDRAAELRALVPVNVRLLRQVGDDLGARLDHLLTSLLGEGYVGAIAVDADSPTLPSPYLEAACYRLLGGAADVVLGPSDDGGYYLIGLRRPASFLFQHMAWSTPSVLDVDRGPDLERLLQPAPPEAFQPRRTLALLADWIGRGPARPAPRRRGVPEGFPRC